jgi:hypothetical protein
MDTNKYENILLNLKIISMIPRNGKIKRSDNGSITLENQDLLVPFKRYLFGDGRRQSLSDINGILEETFSILKILINSKSLVDTNFQLTDDNIMVWNQIHVIFKELHRSRLGLNHLKNTYKDDFKIVASIELIIDKVSFQIKEMTRKFKFILPEYNGDEYNRGKSEYVTSGDVDMDVVDSNNFFDY